MDEDLTIGNNFPLLNVVTEKGRGMVRNPWKRSLSMDQPIGLNSNNVEIRNSKSLTDIQSSSDLCTENVSSPGKVTAESNQQVSSIINNGFIDPEIQAIGEGNDMGRENLIDYKENGMYQIDDEKLTVSSKRAEVIEDAKDNKEEMGRCMDFIGRDLIKMTVKVAGRKYIVDEVQLQLSPLDEERHMNMGASTVSIKNNEIQCDDTLIKAFLEEGRRSYKAKLMKELGVEREIEYVSLDSRPSSRTSTKSTGTNSSQIIIHSNSLIGTDSRPARDENRSYVSNAAGPSGLCHQTGQLVVSTAKTNILALEELPENLAKEIQFARKDSSDTLVPTISGMKTVPLKLPPSTAIAGYLFVPPAVRPTHLYYLAQELTLLEVLVVTKKTPSSLAQILMSSEAVVNKAPGLSPLPGGVQAPNLNRSSALDSSSSSLANGFSPPLVRKRGRPPGSRGLKRKFMSAGETSDAVLDDSRQDNNGYKKPKDDLCRKCKGPVQDEPQPEEEEEEGEIVRESRTVNTMVVCDDCEKSYKVGTNHKCTKKKLLKKEEKMINCEFCNRVFSKKAHLSNHMRTHKDYLKSSVKCELCNKWFKKKGEIAMHRAEYHPELIMEYSCDECDLKFDTTTKLTKHKKTHISSLDMTVRCVHCGDCFEVNYYKNFHAIECADNPFNNDSRTDGRVEVTMKKPVAIRSAPLYFEEEEVCFQKEEVLEEHIKKILKKEESDSGQSRRKVLKKKRRFMNLDASSSDEEHPPRKFYRPFSKGSSSGSSQYVYGEEVLPIGIKDERNDVDIEELSKVEVPMEKPQADGNDFQDEEVLEEHKKKITKKEKRKKKRRFINLDAITESETEQPLIELYRAPSRASSGGSSQYIYGEEVITPNMGIEYEKNDISFEEDMNYELS